MRQVSSSTYKLDEFQPIPIRGRLSQYKNGSLSEDFNINNSNKHRINIKIWIAIMIFMATYLIAPIRTNILVTGTDYLPHRESLSRTDTNIIMTIKPLKPYIGMISIPRDLWVPIPNIGENRINAAFFFAEANQPGSGPKALLNAIQTIFGITLKYYIVINMEGLVNVVDSIGGLDVDLPLAMGGLPAGLNHLDGTQALAFARERYSADDFSRMKQGQILIDAALKKIKTPAGMVRTPLVIIETLRAIDTNLPWWLMPRIGFAFLRSSPNGIDYRLIDREMVTPVTTSEGAQVLIPNWDSINPVLMELFGQ